MSTAFTGDIQIADSAPYSSSATQNFPLGARAKTADGRIFRYCKAGGTALVAGKLQQAPAEVTGDQNLACAAAAIGATSITTTTTVTVTANQYAGGYVIGSITPGQGQMYRILSHPAATAAALTITLDDPLRVALTTDSRIDLVANPYNAVVVNPTTATSGPVGVAVYAIPASEFGWIQTGGITAVLSDGGSTVGTNVSASNATAGAVEASVTAQAEVGYAMTGIATTDYGAVMLTIDA